MLDLKSDVTPSDVFPLAVETEFLVWKKYYNTRVESPQALFMGGFALGKVSLFQD
jgi:hypothetical protein